MLLCSLLSASRMGVQAARRVLSFPTSDLPSPACKPFVRRTGKRREFFVQAIQHQIQPKFSDRAGDPDPDIVVFHVGKNGSTRQGT